MRLRLAGGGLRLWLLPAIGLLGGAGLGPALGDGGFVASVDIWEPEQLALLIYDELTGMEDLVIQPFFEGESRDFAWIVPLPAAPEILIQETQLFHQCSYLTQPIRRYRGTGCACNEHDTFTAPATSGGDIEIHDERVVGIYDTKTVTADSAAVLLDYLEEQGYVHDENRARLQQSLQHYIDKSWYFVALKIDTTSAEPFYHQGYYVGGIDPVHFRFASDEPVYPMRISALSAPPTAELLLYVCAAHRTRFDGATTEYAQNFNQYDLEILKDRYPLLGELLKKPCFMTRLRRIFTPEEMDDDLILERARSDGEFRRIFYTGLPFVEGLLVAVVGVGFHRLRRRAESA